MERLINILKNSDIADYKINIRHSESIELFYVLNKLETNRATSIDEVTVTIYIDKEDKRGEASFSYYPYMSDEEIKSVINKKKYAAGFALNPYYDIPSMAGRILYQYDTVDLKAASKEVVEALMNAKQYKKCTFSATEIFLTNTTDRVINSRGVDLSCPSFKGFIEFIPSWEEKGEEVETYNNLEFSTINKEELTKKIDECVELTKARFEAEKLNVDKPVKVIIEGEDAKQYFRFFMNNCTYQYKYQHMNRFELGDNVQGDNVTGTKLNLTLLPRYEGCASGRPFDGDGVTLAPVDIIKDGIASNRFGPYRFGYYLKADNITGQLPILKVEAGDKSFEEMKNEPYIRCVKFSAFQFEEFSGFFGGEVRLGFYFDGKKEIPVTGFSIQGNINEAKGSAILSKEIEVESNYVGPRYIEIKGMGIS